MRIVGSALLAFALVLAPALTSCGKGKTCSVCAREECGNLTFRVTLADGHTVETCCPKCGLEYLKSEARPVASLEVRDFDSATPVDARAAFYVVGSDVTPCKDMHASKTPRDEQGCCIRATYDRCLPSVLAFAAHGRAVEFAQQHGGTLTSFDEL